MNTQDTLLAYSEWLDSKGLVMPGHASHDELAKDFINQWMGLPLAGSETQDTSAIREAVFTALGAASMCWKPKPEGVFDSEAASNVGEALMNRITAARTAVS